MDNNPNQQNQSYSTDIPTNTPLDAVSNVPTQAPEITMSTKPRRRLLPVITGVAALLLVVGVAGAAYYVSNQLSTRQAVAPTAPESKPMATSVVNCNNASQPVCAGKVPGTSCVGTGGTGTCVKSSGDACACSVTQPTQPPSCGTYTTSGTCTAASGCKYFARCSKCASNSLTEVNVCGPTATVTETLSSCDITGACSGSPISGYQFHCLSGGVPKYCCPFGQYNTNGVCTATATATTTVTATVTPVCFSGTNCASYGNMPPGCSRCNCGTTASPSWVIGGSCSDGAAHPSCTTICGTPTSPTVPPASGCEPGCYHYPDENTPNDNCTVCSPNRTKLNSVTFSKAGTVRIHQESMIFSGTIITLTKGSSTITATKVSDGNYDADIVAGTYTISVKLGAASEGGQASLGFIAPNSSNKCGRYPAPTRDISNYKTAAALTSYSIDTLSGVDIPVQCWADRIQGEDNDTRGQLDANYDFDDFNLIIGYKSTEEIGACALIEVRKRITETTYSAKLTASELAGLQVGDMLQFTSYGSLDNLSGRFRVTVNGVAGDWLAGTQGDGKSIYYRPYTVSEAGSYKFEAQVSTTVE